MKKEISRFSISRGHFHNWHGTLLSSFVFHNIIKVDTNKAKNTNPDSQLPKLRLSTDTLHQAVRGQRYLNVSSMTHSTQWVMACVSNVSASPRLSGIATCIPRGVTTLPDHRTTATSPLLAAGCPAKTDNGRTVRSAALRQGGGP